MTILCFLVYKEHYKILTPCMHPSLLHRGEVHQEVVQPHTAPAGSEGRRLQELCEGQDDVLHLGGETWT